MRVSFVWQHLHSQETVLGFAIYEEHRYGRMLKVLPDLDPALNVAVQCSHPCGETLCRAVEAMEQLGVRPL